MKKIWCVLALVFCMLFTSCKFNGPSYVTYENADKYSVGNTTIESKITKLYICWISDSVKISYSDDNLVHIKETSNVELEQAKQVHYWVNESELLIQPSSCGEFTFKTNEKNLEIMIPKSTYEQIKIDSVSNLIDVKVDTSRLIIDNVSGNINVEAKIDSISVNSVSGNGTYKLTGIKLINVDNVSGNHSFTLPKDSKIKAKLSSVSGDLTNPFDEGNDIEVTMNTVSGNLTLIKSE